MKFSLITLVYNREKHLQNLLKGVRKNAIKPNEILIVNMGDVPDLSAFKDLPLSIYNLPVKTKVLPLARARNYGAQKAQYDLLFFLDVDCVPSVNYFEELLSKYQKYKGVIMATPRYLTTALYQDFDEQKLQDWSISHPHRPEVIDCELCRDPGMFWSLCFVITKENFSKLGGFDEQFIGYGGEDTDFGFSLRERNTGFYIAETLVYHQQHPVYAPPVHKMGEIVKNSKVFYKKWGIWPMGGWLQAFVDRELISWNNEAEEILVQKQPDRELLERCYKEDAPFM